MKNKVLFFSYWYPNKTNKILPGSFIKKHAQAISLDQDLTVLSIHFLKKSCFLRKSKEVIYDEKGVETHQIYIESFLPKLLYVLLPLHYLILRKYISKHISPEFKFNIIHSNILFPCAIVGYWLSRHFKCRHVISEQWSKVGKFFKKSLYKPFGKKALDRAHAITCVSQLLQATEQQFTGNKNIFVVPNVIDRDEFYMDPGVAKHETFTFIAAASWAPPKNPFYFLDALNQLVIEKKMTDFQLYLVGSGSQLDEIKKNNYHFKIHYTGTVNSKELNILLNKSHRFLHASDYETFSVIIAEALMCGLASIVSPVGIAGEVINPANGFIADNTVQDWYEKIYLSYCTTYNSEQISRQLNNLYGPKNVSSQFSDVYNKIV